MNKYDVVQKISPFSIPWALVAKVPEPYQILKDHGVIRGDWHPYYFNWGRNALFALFQQLPYKTIHFPAFTCPVLTDAAKEAGKRIALLEVDRTYNLDLDRLPKKAPECLVAVHTFGNPLDISVLRKQYPKTYIIEDCAHALFAKINNTYVGSDGDAILFSLYKQVPNLNGALLLTKDPLNLKQNQEPLSAFWPRILFKTEGPHHYLVNQLRRQYINTLEDKTFSVQQTVHPLIAALFAKGLKDLLRDYQQLQQIRNWYSRALDNNPYMDDQQISASSVPSVYHFTVILKPEAAFVRNDVVTRLRNQSIFLDRLWYNAPVRDKKYSDNKNLYSYANHLANSVITLPIQTSLTKSEITNLISRLNQTIKALL